MISNKSYQGQDFVIERDTKGKIVSVKLVKRNEILLYLLCAISVALVGVVCYDKIMDLVDFVKGVKRVSRGAGDKGYAQMMGFTMGNLKRSGSILALAVAILAVYYWRETTAETQIVIGQPLDRLLADANFIS